MWQAREYVRPGDIFGLLLSKLTPVRISSQGWPNATAEWRTPRRLLGSKIERLQYPFCRRGGYSVVWICRRDLSSPEWFDGQTRGSALGLVPSIYSTRYSTVCDTYNSRNGQSRGHVSNDMNTLLSWNWVLGSWYVVYLMPVCIHSLLQSALSTHHHYCSIRLYKSIRTSSEARDEAL